MPQSDRGLYRRDYRAPLPAGFGHEGFGFSGKHRQSKGRTSLVIARSDGGMEKKKKPSILLGFLVAIIEIHPKP